MGELLVMGWFCDTIFSLLWHKLGGRGVLFEGKTKTNMPHYKAKENIQLSFVRCSKINTLTYQNKLKTNP